MKERTLQSRSNQSITTQPNLNLQPKSQPHQKRESNTTQPSPAQPRRNSHKQALITHHPNPQNNSSHPMHNHPDRRQAIATLASPAHTRERSASTLAAVLDCAALCWRRSVSPNEVSILNAVRNLLPVWNSRCSLQARYAHIP
jgi:hypothetical protein